MGPITLAQQADYWLAGALTAIGAVLATVVILMSSRSDNDNALP